MGQGWQRGPLWLLFQAIKKRQGQGKWFHWDNSKPPNGHPKWWSVTKGMLLQVLAMAGSSSVPLCGASWCRELCVWKSNMGKRPRTTLEWTDANTPPYWLTALWVAVKLSRHVSLKSFFRGYRLPLNPEVWQFTYERRPLRKTCLTLLSWF